MGKIVYILGAGFSIPYGLPAQKEIMKYCFKDEKFVKKIKNFYREFYLFSSKRITIKSLSDIPLEDVFSLLDKSIKSAHKYKNLKVSDFIKMENILTSKIASFLEEQINNPKEIEYIKNFINKLIKFRKDSNNQDRQSIITLNWDTVIENYFYNELKDDKTKIDYCMYDYSFEKQFDNSIEYIPSIYLKIKEFNNIKLIKLHGSINWNICNSCHRVYVNTKPILENNKYKCKNCDVELEKFIISPTFMKEFQANHIKNIWHNAFIDLSEATHIVFIGYSFPLADFEFKILLSKALKKDIKITVVDFKDKEKSIFWSDLTKRYKTFFGNNVDFYNKGVKRYIEEKMDLDLSNVLQEDK